MEYNEETFKKSQSYVDMNKVNAINRFGSAWIGLDCTNEVEQDICQQRKDLAYAYGNEFVKIRAKAMECEKFMEESSFTSQADKEFEMCVDSIEKSLRITIDSFYEKFISLSK